MLPYILLLVAGILLPDTSHACASCGCTLAQDWQTSSESAWKFDLRYDYINQNQLRAGASTISGASASTLSNNGNSQEVEKYTVNNYVTATLDYIQNPSWRFSLILPYISRGHSTLGTASDGTTAGAGGGQYTSNQMGLGDVKLISRFQGFSEQHDWGVTLGVKLPTGLHTQMGTSTDPTAPAAVSVDRGLQLGTGTTDLIAGVFYGKAVSKNWDIYGETFVQTALNMSDQYKPGDGYNLNFGTRYVGFESWTPQIQINSRAVLHDNGANADTVSTGGILVYASPGAAVMVATATEVYAFVQIPLYQLLYGVQLAPTSTESVGVRYFF